ncbi:MBL fold hydrolase [Pseudovibrio japonicus]|uniref:MBL fold hydrolase n=1 Tax=Pseudovibrio japonicus TaxID=366534 RepID=A0ABQ3ENH0_9HYPH|nr:MBL fold metallo-hydrolase [Pseudovibrio japonicus]GHB39469.1 MBL fold hydrolase [Pseudovibrio japonicus]
MSSRDFMKLSRRGALALGAGGLLATGVRSSEVAAEIPMETSSQHAPATEFQLGEFKVYTLLDGSFVAEHPQDTFGMDQTSEVFAQASHDHFIPDDKFRGFFTPTLVNTGDTLVLFDTGRGTLAQPESGNLLRALNTAGIRPGEIDVVVLTHMHADHTGGLMHNDAPTFPRARYVTSPIEFDYWEQLGPAANQSARVFADNVLPLREKFTFIEPGGEVVPGITAVEAYGHTPGHMAYSVEANGQKLMLTADTANHFAWSLAYPDWRVVFDIDKARAAETRRRIFGMIAEERIPFIGYHMPFPALGFVEAVGDGFRYIPGTYQLQLGNEDEQNRPE